VRLAGAYVIPLLKSRGYIKSFEGPGVKNPAPAMSPALEQNQTGQNSDSGVVKQPAVTKTKPANKVVNKPVEDPIAEKPDDDTAQ
jgi:hypothetical protein